MVDDSGDIDDEDEEEEEEANDDKLGDEGDNGENSYSDASWGVFSLSVFECVFDALSESLRVRL